MNIKFVKSFSSGQTEAELKKEMKAWFEEYGIYYITPRGGPYSGRAGVPDFITCYNGVFIALEVKGKSGKLSVHQRRERVAILEAQGIVCTVRPDNWGTIKRDVYGIVD